MEVASWKGKLVDDVVVVGCYRRLQVVITYNETGDLCARSERAVRVDRRVVDQLKPLSED